MTNKNWTIKLLIIFSFIASTVILINYIVDPFQHYRVSSWYKITQKKQREVTAGLAKNFPYYETAIIGSSMAENFKASFVNKELNTTTLKLCMSGITAHEMYSILKTVLRDNNNIKNIILAIDINNFTGDKNRIRTNAFPSYLYDNNPINDIFYLLNKETIRFSFRMLEQSGTTTNFDELWYTANMFKYSKKAALSRYIPGTYGPSFTLDDYNNEVIKENFNFNILPFIHKNKNVKFTIFYPPYSFLIYKDMKNKRWLNESFKFKKYLLNLNIKNLDIYDFQCIPKITSNLNIYRDIAHYSPSINEYIIKSFKNKNHLSTQNNIDNCIQIIKNSANIKLKR